MLVILMSIFYGRPIMVGFTYNINPFRQKRPRSSPVFIYFIYLFIHSSLVHTMIHSHLSTHTLYSFRHAFIYDLVSSHTYSFFIELIPTLIHSLISTYIPSPIDLFPPSFIHSSVHTFLHPLTYSHPHSFTHQYIHSFTH